MNQTALIVEHGVDEMAAAGLEPLPSRLVRPPRVKGSPVHFECRLHQIVALPGHKPSSVHHVVIGHVVAVHIDDAALTDGWPRGCSQDAADRAARLQGLHQRRVRCSRWRSRRPKTTWSRGKAGKRGVTELAGERIEPMGLFEITPELARESGFLGVVDLLKVAKHGKGENVYLVRFHHIGPPSNVAGEKASR